MKTAVEKFSCKRAPELEAFLRNRAGLFDELGKSRTYFLLDKADIESGRLEISAFFSVAMRVMNLPSSMSVRQIQRLDGFSGKMHGEKINALPVCLIGQLARNDAYPNALDGGAILSYALSTIQRAHKIVGGRIIMVDVNSSADGLIRFYQRYGFKISGTDDAAGLTQLIVMLS